jgi:hypothetical protein
LRRTLAQNPPLETRRRIAAVLDELDPEKTPARRRQERVLQALEHLDTAEARDILKELAEGEPNVRLTREAKAALERLTRRDPAR